MDTRASRYAIWRLHATPSKEFNPNPQKGGYPVPDRVTFLNGSNRDFPTLNAGDKREGFCALKDVVDAHANERALTLQACRAASNMQRRSCSRR
jgi:hypothetical protein